MIRDYEEGAKVIIDDECFKKIKDHQRSSISGYPHDKYIKTIKSVLNVEGIVTKRFKPGYEFNVTWNIPYKRSFDGKTQNTTVVQVKDNWVKPLDNKWKEVNGI